METAPTLPPSNILPFDPEVTLQREFREAYQKFSTTTIALGAPVNEMWKKLWDLKLHRSFPQATFVERVRVATLQNGTPPEQWDVLFKQLAENRIVVEIVEYDPTTRNFTLYGRVSSV